MVAPHRPRLVAVYAAIVAVTTSRVSESLGAAFIATLEGILPGATTMVSARSKQNNILNILSTDVHVETGSLGSQTLAHDLKDDESC